MIDDEQRRAVRLGQPKPSLSLIHRCSVADAMPESQNCAVTLRDQEVLELPRVGRVDLRPVEAVEHVGVVLQRRPVRGDGNELAQVGLADVQDVVVRQVVGHAHAPRRILDHPHARGDDGDRHLHRGGVLVRHQAARLLDARDPIRTTTIDTDAP